MSAGFDESGVELFSLRFTMNKVTDVETGAAGFLFAIPVRDDWAGALATITLAGPEGSVALEAGDASRPATTLVLDAVIRRIVAILRETPVAQSRGRRRRRESSPDRDAREQWNPGCRKLAAMTLLTVATRHGRRSGLLSALAAVVLPFLAVDSVAAQEPGDTVRVSGEQVGVVVEADSAGLLLSFGYVPYAGMQRLEVWGGVGNHTMRGLKYGFMAGAIPSGALVTFYCLSGCSASDYAMGLATRVGIGVLAGAVGSLIGSAVETDIWRPVPIPGGAFRSSPLLLLVPSCFSLPRPTLISFSSRVSRMLAERGPDPRTPRDPQQGGQADRDLSLLGNRLRS